MLGIVFELLLLFIISRLGGELGSLTGKGIGLDLVLFLVILLPPIFAITYVVRDAFKNAKREIDPSVTTARLWKKALVFVALLLVSWLWVTFLVGAFVQTI